MNGVTSNQCKNCGQEISDEVTECPNCGQPIFMQVQPEGVEAEFTTPSPKKKSKRWIVVGILAVVIIAIIIAAAVNSNSKNTYSENLRLASYTMISGASDAEDAGNLIKSVWYNSIYEVRDAATDPYTRTYGTFYDDFNDALRALFADSDFSDAISDIEANQDAASEIMRSLKNPPDEYEDAYDAIRDFYNAYLELTNLVINPNGSLQTFSASFNSADNNAARAYKALQMYLD